MNTLRLALRTLSGLLAVPLSAFALQLTPNAPPAAPTPMSTLDQAPATAPGAPQSGAGIIAEVTRMIQARTDANVIKAYIQNWPSGYVVTADDLLHLHDLGAPTDVLTELIRHSAQLQAQRAVQASPGTPDLVSTNAMPLPYPGDTNPVPPAVIYPYPSYSYQTPNYVPTYSYPAYTYSYLYPYSLFPDYGYYGYWGSPYIFGAPYYRFGYYPHYYGYGYRHGYGYGYPGYGHYYGGRPYGFGGHYGGRYGGGHFGFGHR